MTDKEKDCIDCKHYYTDYDCREFCEGRDMFEPKKTMTLDEKIEEIEKAIERLEKSAEQEHSERMFVAIAEAVREEKQTLEWLKDYKRLLESPENQKTGHWIVNPKGIYAHLVCDKCLSNAPYDCQTNYCPNCGAEMGEQK